MRLDRVFSLCVAGLLGAQGLAEDSQADNGTETHGRRASAKADLRDKAYPWIGKIERHSGLVDKLLAPDAVIEKLASGFEWSEGPVWVKRGRYLLFSDVPNNIVYKWKHGVGTREFLYPSGYTGEQSRGGEPGSNGLTVDKRGDLILCQHGDRRVARLKSDGQFETIARYYKNRRFNSPNDLVYKSNGDLYFTDPPYGLVGNNKDPKKELNFNGVYKVNPEGEVTLLTSELSFPNGIAFSPDERTLYVAVSDPKRPVIVAYDVRDDGTVSGERVFFDAAELLKAGGKGLPDGLKVDMQGNLWATGPGGVLIISPDGQHLGTINTGEATANCAWGDDGSTLYITADMYLCRVKTLIKGFGY